MPPFYCLPKFLTLHFLRRQSTLDPSRKGAICGDSPPRPCAICDYTNSPRACITFYPRLARESVPLFLLPSSVRWLCADAHWTLPAQTTTSLTPLPALHDVMLSNSLGTGVSMCRDFPHALWPGLVPPYGAIAPSLYSEAAILLPPGALSKAQLLSLAWKNAPRARPPECDAFLHE